MKSEFVEFNRKSLCGIGDNRFGVVVDESLVGIA